MYDTHTHALVSTFQRIVQHLLIAQIGRCHKKINKIEQYYHPIQNAQMASEQGSHWLIENPTLFHYV